MDAWAPTLPIETDRLILRAHRPTDADDLVVFHSDPVTTHYIPWPVRTVEETKEALDEKLTRTIAVGRGDWIVLAIEERDTGTVIGEVMLKRVEDTIAEVGYVIRRDRVGQGLASEAVTAMLEVARGLDLERVEAVIRPENEPSIRLIERLGFVRDPERDTVEDGVALGTWVLPLS